MENKSVDRILTYLLIRLSKVQCVQYTFYTKHIVNFCFLIGLTLHRVYECRSKEFSVILLWMGRFNSFAVNNKLSQNLNIEKQVLKAGKTMQVDIAFVTVVDGLTKLNLWSRANKSGRLNNHTCTQQNSYSISNYTALWLHSDHTSSHYTAQWLHDDYHHNNEVTSL